MVGFITALHNDRVIGNERSLKTQNDESLVIGDAKAKCKRKIEQEGPGRTDERTNERMNKKYEKVQ